MKLIRWILGRVILILDFATRPSKMIRPEPEQNKIDKIPKKKLYKYRD
jgi:hypothetical protein